MATAYLLRRVIETYNITNVSGLIQQVQQVGHRLSAAQPREIAIRNIVRRVLGLIREEADEDRDGETSGYSDAGTDSRPQSARENDASFHELSGVAPRALHSSPLQKGTSDQPSQDSRREPREDGVFQRPPLLTAHASYTNSTTGPVVTSMFSLLSHPRSNVPSPTATPGSQSPRSHPSFSNLDSANLTAIKDIRAEIVEGIQEILEELNQADDQIASYALEHIHSSEIILTHTSSITVLKFLLKAAAKRKFTVIQAEAFPNDHEATHAAVVGHVKDELDEESRSESFQKSLTAAGITVILIPDSAVYALMSRVNKVILDTHIVLANGGLVAVAGAKVIAKAASMHRIPVIVLGAVYKLSPVYPYVIDLFMEDGDPGAVASYGDGNLMCRVEVENPLFDYIPPELVDLYITNL